MCTWSAALRKVGYKAECFTSAYSSKTSKRENWGRILPEEYVFCLISLKPLLAFAHSLFLYDVFGIQICVVPHKRSFRTDAVILSPLIPYFGFGLRFGNRPRYFIENTNRYLIAIPRLILNS